MTVLKKMLIVILVLVALVAVSIFALQKFAGVDVREKLAGTQEIQANKNQSTPPHYS